MIASLANERGSYYPLCWSDRCHSSSSGVLVGVLAACFTVSHLIQGWMIEQKLLFPSRQRGQFVLLRPFRPRHLTCLFGCHLLDLAAQEMSSPSLCISLCLTPKEEGVPRDVQLNLIDCQDSISGFAGAGRERLGTLNDVRKCGGPFIHSQAVFHGWGWAV